MSSQPLSNRRSATTMETNISVQSESQATVQRICPACKPTGTAFTSEAHNCECMEVERSVGGTTPIDEYFHEIMRAAELAMDQFAPDYNPCEFLQSLHVSAKQNKAYHVEIAFTGVLTDNLNETVSVEEPAAHVSIEQFTSNGTLTIAVSPEFCEADF